MVLRDIFGKLFFFYQLIGKGDVKKNVAVMWIGKEVKPRLTKYACCSSSFPDDVEVVCLDVSCEPCFTEIIVVFHLCGVFG